MSARWLALPVALLLTGDAAFGALRAPTSPASVADLAQGAVQLLILLAAGAWLGVWKRMPIRQFLQRLVNLAAAALLLAVLTAAFVAWTFPVARSWGDLGPAAVLVVVLLLASRLVLLVPALVLDGVRVHEAFASSWLRMRGHTLLAALGLLVVGACMTWARTMPYGPALAAAVNVFGTSLVMGGFWSVAPPPGPGQARVGALAPSAIPHAPARIWPAHASPAPGRTRLVSATTLPEVQALAVHRDEVWIRMPPDPRLVAAAADAGVGRIVVDPQELPILQGLRVPSRWTALLAGDVLIADQDSYERSDGGWVRAGASAPGARPAVQGRPLHPQAR